MRISTTWFHRRRKVILAGISTVLIVALATIALLSFLPKGQSAESANINTKEQPTLSPSDVSDDALSRSPVTYSACPPPPDSQLEFLTADQVRARESLPPVTRDTPLYVTCSTELGLAKELAEALKDVGYKKVRILE